MPNLILIEKTCFNSLGIISLQKNISFVLLNVLQNIEFS